MIANKALAFSSLRAALIANNTLAFSPLKALAAAPPPSILNSYFSSSPSIQQREESEKWRQVRVSVWWDVESCPVPEDVELKTAFFSIKGAIKRNGMNGHRRISVFADLVELYDTYRKCTSLLGATTNHVPNGGVDSRAYKALLENMMAWVSRNPPPAHLFLICSDHEGLARTLQHLRERNYNVLLATNGDVSPDLCRVASAVWRWNYLAEGDRIARYFNQPPDASLYGHYDRKLQDPLLGLPLLSSGGSGGFFSKLRIVLDKLRASQNSQ